MKPSEDDVFRHEGPLDVGEAKRVLPRLERDGIRFQIEANVSTHLRRSVSTYRDSRITLFVHADNVVKWRKIRDENDMPVRADDAVRQTPRNHPPRA